jgi:hypothetical protein
LQAWFAANSFLLFPEIPVPAYAEILFILRLILRGTWHQQVR